MGRGPRVPVRTRAIIGLYLMGIRDPERIVRHAFCSEPTQWKLRVARGIIRRIESGKLTPVEVDTQTAFVRHPVRCPECGVLLSLVPCISCFPILKIPQGLDDQDDYPGLRPGEPTQSRPGSEEKIEIMRQRVARGELPCHPKDKRLKPPRIPWAVPIVRITEYRTVIEEDYQG